MSSSLPDGWTSTTLAEVCEIQLDGKDLACWCPLPEPGEIDWCHARVLLKIANGDDDA
ncbi:DUF4326 domain-containing protein [Streptosporangium canum]|uniref:DUF4326 domain-containing protein n=1 Tax=Streptosporangium canum TaxID=324952 RepID=UPI003433D541